MKIRTAAAADAAVLFGLEQSLFSADNYPISRRMFSYHIRNSLLLVAETDNGEVAGYALALIRRRIPKIYSLGIATKHRSMGIASTLLSSVLKRLQRQGFKQVVLEVRIDNPAAVALYRKFGFETVKTVNSFYKDGCSAQLMQLILDEKKGDFREAPE